MCSCSEWLDQEAKQINHMAFWVPMILHEQINHSRDWNFSWQTLMEFHINSIIYIIPWSSVSCKPSMILWLIQCRHHVHILQLTKKAERKGYFISWQWLRLWLGLWLQCCWTRNSFDKLYWTLQPRKWAGTNRTAWFWFNRISFACTWYSNSKLSSQSKSWVSSLTWVAVSANALMLVVFCYAKGWNAVLKNGYSLLTHQRLLERRYFCT